jgi:glycosyltransferase involved in cell wall biosynthesis
VRPLIPKAVQGTWSNELRIAIVHYWFVARRGGERVVEALAEMFPQADFYTLVLDRKALAPALQTRTFTTSFLQALPGSKHYYRKLLPLFPLALEQFRLDDYDLVISSESGPAKGVLTRGDTCHICYCHTPMRYIWDAYHRYRQASGLIARTAFSLVAHYMRNWDFATASRVDHFIANSENVASRIRKHYRREARVINPPVNISSGYISDAVEDYYLVVGQLVDYKRIDLAIEACNRLARPLRIIGHGEQYKRLRRLAGPTVQFLGSQPDEDVHKNYSRCRALLFPGEEDFGIVPVEAQSFGRPVIAYGRGGALETVRGLFTEELKDPLNSTGIFFREQSVESLVNAIKALEAIESRLDPEFIRTQVERFDVSRFKAEMSEFIAEKLREFRGRVVREEPVPVHFSSPNPNAT